MNVLWQLAYDDIFVKNGSLHDFVFTQRIVLLYKALNLLLTDSFAMTAGAHVRKLDNELQDDKMESKAIGDQY